MIKFGTDGWRAVIADDFTFENVKIVTQAIADYLNNKTAGLPTGQAGSKKVIVGYDSRFLSFQFAQTAALVLAANKIRVVLSNKYIPTPIVSFFALYGKYDLGIMITASHNPSQFNGLKIKTPQGGAADKSLTDKIETLLYKSKPKYIDIESAKREKLLEVVDLTQKYTMFLRNFVNLKKISKLKLRILVDTMYGVGDKFVEKILEKSKIKIDYLHNEFNPSFGGINPEPVEGNLGELIARVKKEKYDLGVALDGDADRIAVVDKFGNFINAQVLLPLLAVHVVKNRMVKAGIGKTVVGSNLIDEVAYSLGVACYETPVGFKYISSLFKDGLICIGGEEAGGIGFKDYIPERDATAAFLFLLEMLAWENKSFSALLADFYKKYGKWYYSRASVPSGRVKKSINNLKLPSLLCGKKVERVNTLDGIKLITKESWLMFRKSGTEPIVRVYAESKTKNEANQLVALGKKMIYGL